MACAHALVVTLEHALVALGRQEDRREEEHGSQAGGSEDSGPEDNGSQARGPEDNGSQVDGQEDGRAETGGEEDDCT